MFFNCSREEKGLWDGSTVRVKLCCEGKASGRVLETARRAASSFIGYRNKRGASLERHCTIIHV